MRIVPVLDLKGGVAVHAVRGERQSYAPVRSVLSPSADPVALARAFQERPKFQNHREVNGTTGVSCRSGRVRL